MQMANCGSSDASPVILLLGERIEKRDLVADIIRLLGDDTMQAICEYQKHKQGIGQLSQRPCSDLVKFRIVTVLADFSFNVGIPEVKGAQFFADKFNDNPHYPDCPVTE
ncbi:MAG: hypothetical protein Q7T51_04505 [Candidatus Moranbacteria bacterium]|nr:hypothetical protein [Candidatus Moranbacteria bacterium]